MAISTKIIRRRIRSIGNTKKITKAMELVAAAKMRRAVNAVTASRAYATIAWQIVSNVATRIGEGPHPLLQPHEAQQRLALIIVSSNRGLCGGFNSHIVTAALNYSDQQMILGFTEQSWIAVGKKGAEALARQRRPMIAEFEKQDVVAGVEDSTALVSMVMKGYRAGQFDRVAVAYTDFVTPLLQRPRVKQLLPIQPTVDKELGSVGLKKEADVMNIDTREYMFEPSPTIVLDQLLPRLIEVQLYQALLESTASEHSARMLAMRNASDAATDMIDGLTLVYNQARQASITREIAEISGGKAALE